MKSFAIRDLSCSIAFFPFDLKKQGFTYPFKLTNDLNVKEIVIVHPEIIDSLIYSNFNKRYKKIWEYYLYSLQEDDDTTSGRLMMALDEIARLRSIIIRKYHRNISKQKEEMMLKKLKLLENEMRIKIIDFNIIKEQEFAQDNNIQEKSKTR